MGKSRITVFVNSVRETIANYHMFERGDRVMIAVSGGADSVCLARILDYLGTGLKIEMAIANLDHGIRGAESQRDSAFVRDLATDMGLEYVHKRVKISGGGKKKMSLEEAAREERYMFLTEEARARGYNVVATGHTLDDQAETVLMRVISGSSIAGLTGIPPVRISGETRIVRPLIRSQRSDILAFLGEMKQGYVEDSSNQDPRFMRNRVRKDLLPGLAAYNPQIRRSLANMADSLREDLALLSRDRMDAAGRRDDGRLELADILSQPRAIRKEILKQMFLASGGNAKRLTYRHWMDMDRLLRTGAERASLDLPGDVSIIKTRKDLHFKKVTGRGKTRSKD
ncbi:MAG: tRNA lysidine(34) synthetase TilS [Candidatus Omnitrophica bacterium]|nr:tRNA lysidine(34) synthetase TilS [Candidatus Omnitrophota bacterium]MDD5487433.1 tRNA lysidine(34) synthetase TilS [Candidatus Omnitrophota bacterium]